MCDKIELDFSLVGYMEGEGESRGESVNYFDMRFQRFGILVRILEIF